MELSDEYRMVKGPWRNDVEQMNEYLTPSSREIALSTSDEDQIFEAACDWFDRSREGPLTPADQEDFQRWLTVPGHRKEYKALLGLADELRSLPPVEIIIPTPMMITQGCPL